MKSICFVGTYNPIMCGIADYTKFITRKMPPDKWGVLSFDLANFKGRLVNRNGTPADRIWYGIPSFDDFSAADLLEGLSQLGNRSDDVALWFQHEHGIWRDNYKFINMLRQLDIPKIVTLHTLHFQSSETPSGLHREHVEFLRQLLPEVDAITVFSNGVYGAVTAAFPQYSEKVRILKHGIPSHKEVTALTRREARQKLHDFLMYESDLDQATKESLHNQRILLNRDNFIIGETGFLCPGKQSEFLYLLRDVLTGLLPGRKIIALRIGAPRDSFQMGYATKLRQEQNGTDKFLVETCLPEDMLRVAQRAFDINFYWPELCTQSGILAHAIGAGSLIAGREMEGSGEMLREAGAITGKSMEEVVEGIVRLMSNPELGLVMEEQALKYAAKLSWENQSRQHWEIASELVPALAGSVKNSNLTGPLGYISPRYTVASSYSQSRC